jgi:hypothetical protein
MDQHELADGPAEWLDGALGQEVRLQISETCGTKAGSGLSPRAAQSASCSRSSAIVPPRRPTTSGPFLRRQLCRRSKAIRNRRRTVLAPLDQGQADVQTLGGNRAAADPMLAGQGLGEPAHAPSRRRAELGGEEQAVILGPIRHGNAFCDDR